MDEKQWRTLMAIFAFIGLCFVVFLNWSALGLPQSQRGWVLNVFWIIIACCCVGAILAAILIVLWDVIKFVLFSAAVIGTVIFYLSLFSPKSFSPPLTQTDIFELLIVTAVLWIFAIAMHKASSNFTTSDDTDYHES
jgi:hypothetical protein